LTVNDPRLPGGTVTLNDLYDVIPSKFGQVNNYVTAAKNFGQYIQQYDGFDLTVAARAVNGLTLQGGTSYGRTLNDVCDIVTKIDSPSAPRADTAYPAGTPTNNAAALLSPSFCRTSERIVQGKALASYTLPKIDVQVSATVQSLPGIAIIANYTVPVALITPSLGRPLAGNAPNLTINLMKPYAERGDRINHVDFRAAKVLTLAGLRTQVSIDFFNALNSNAVQAEDASFLPGGSYRAPTNILDARLIKLTAQISF